MPAANRQWTLKRRPRGVPADEDFELVEARVPEPGDGEFVTRNLILSVDPAQRGWMDEGIPESPVWTKQAPERAAEQRKLEEKRRTAVGSRDNGLL